MNDTAGTFSESQKKAFVRVFLRAIMLNDQSLGHDEMDHLYRIFSRLSIEPGERQDVVYRATLEPSDIIDDTSISLVDQEIKEQLLTEIFSDLDTDPSRRVVLDIDDTFISLVDQQVKEQLLIEIFSYLDTAPSRRVVLDDIRKGFSDDQISSLQQEGQRRNINFRYFNEKESEMRKKYDGSSADQPEISDENFWSKIKGVAKKIGKKPLWMILVIWYCFRDPKTPLKIKAALAVPLLYFISPIDAIPDLIPFVGLTDDAGVIAAAVRLFASYIQEHHYRQADEKMKEWFGDDCKGTDEHYEPGGTDETIQEIKRLSSYADTDRKAFEEKRQSETNHTRHTTLDEIIDHLRHIADAYRI